MSDSLELIQSRVTEELRKNAAVDVYRLTAVLQEHCPELPADVIAEEVSAAIIKAHGNAIWNKG